MAIERRDLLAVLKQCLASESGAPLEPMVMLDSDLRDADFTSQELDRYGPVEIPGL